MNPSKRTLRIITLVLFILLFIIAGYLTLPSYFSRESGQSAGETGEITEAESADVPIQVTAEPAFRGELVLRVSATGLAKALREVTICPKIGGEIQSLPIQNGDFVREGQLLMKLDGRELSIALAKAKDQLLGAQSQYGFMKQDYRANPNLVDYAQTNPSENPNESSAAKFAAELVAAEKRFAEAKQRYAKGEISGEELAKLQFEFETSKIVAGQKQDEMRRQKSGLTRAYLDVQQAELNLSYTEIHAPFAGVIADLRVQTSQQAAAGKECFKLLDLSQVEVDLQVLESEIGRIKVGRKAELNFPAYPDETFRGQVIAINPLVDSESKTSAVTGCIPNPQQKILPGMFAYAKLEAQILKDKFLVPKEAILIRDQRKLLFVVRDGLAKWCYVTTGLENEDYVEILDSTLGLQPGEPVITEGHYTLVHDAKVKVD